VRFFLGIAFCAGVIFSFLSEVLFLLGAIFSLLPNVGLCLETMFSSLPNINFRTETFFLSFPHFDFCMGTIFLLQFHYYSLTNTTIVTKTCYRKTGKTRVYTQFRSRNEAQPQHCHTCTIFSYLCRTGNGLFCLMQTIRSVLRRGFLFYFVKNVDYAEIQVELDGTVEEQRTRPVDRRIGPPACLLP